MTGSDLSASDHCLSAVTEDSDADDSIELEETYDTSSLDEKQQWAVAEMAVEMEVAFAEVAEARQQLLAEIMAGEHSFSRAKRELHVQLNMAIADVYCDAYDRDRLIDVIALACAYAWWCDNGRSHLARIEDWFEETTSAETTVTADDD